MHGLQPIPAVVLRDAGCTSSSSESGPCGGVAGAGLEAEDLDLKPYFIAPPCPQHHTLEVSSSGKLPFLHLISTVG